MSYRIGIIGSGNVGVSYAFSIINQGLDINEIILIDIDKDKTKGEALDLSHSLAFCKGYINNIKCGEYKDIEDVDILCITAGMSQSNNKKSRMEDIKGANQIIEDIMKKVNESRFDGIILVASNPLDIMTLKIARMYNNNFKKVIGSGTLLDSARLRYEISSRLNFPLNSISGYVFGEHGDSQFIAWSSVKINNEYSIDDYLSIKDKLEIEDKIKREGFNVSKLKGYTCYGVANALSRITKSIIYDEKAILPVCSYDEEQEIYISSLSKIGREGVIENKLYKFSEKEKELYNLSSKVIKEGAKSILFFK